MIISAMYVQNAENEQGVNLFAYWYGEPFSDDVSFEDILKSDNFHEVVGQKHTRRESLCILRPGNNLTMAYIYLISRHTMGREEAKKALQMFEQDVPDMSNPAQRVYALEGREIFVKYSTILRWEDEFESKLKSMTGTIHHFMDERVWPNPLKEE